VSTELEFGMPIGNYSDVNGVGGGVMLAGEYPLLDALSATARIGFQYHANKTVAATDVHVHSIPILLGAKYYLMPDRQGLFGAVELGLFDLMTSAGKHVAERPEVRHRRRRGLCDEAVECARQPALARRRPLRALLMITAGVGYQFAGF